MKIFAEYLARIDNPEHRDQTKVVLVWVAKKFPNLIPKISWNQPMFTNQGTFIIGFSVTKHHLTVTPERACVKQFSMEIVQAGYNHNKQLVYIPWDSPVDFPLLEKMIEFNILDKANCLTFWRK